MESVPQVPDEQTRNAVTWWITDCVAGWPASASPSSATATLCLTPRTCPTTASPLRSSGCATRTPPTSGHRDLQGQHRLVYQKQASRLLRPPGTPEQGIDETFVLYAGPPAGN